MEAVSLSGSVEVTDRTTGRLLARSLSGDVRVEARPEQAADFRLTSTSGRVALSVPESSNLKFSVSTTSGSIDSDLPLSEAERGDRYLKGLLNDPDGSVEISTVSGDVTLGRLE